MRSSAACGDVESPGNVAADGIVRAGLVGEQIGDYAAAREFGNHVRAISDETDRCGFALAHGVFQNAQRLVEIVDHHVAIAGLHAALDAFRIDVDAEKRRAIESCGERLRAAHSAHAAADDEFSGEIALKMFSRGRCKGFVGALENSLRADVDPASCGHLAVHHQAGAIELVEMLPVAPVADEIRIRDEDARGVRVRAENSNRLARLDEKRLVIFKRAERGDDSVKAFPVARRFASPAVDDQIFGFFSDLGIEIVHQHAQRSFLLPAFAGNGGAARRSDGLMPGRVALCQRVHAIILVRNDTSARVRHWPIAWRLGDRLEWLR